MKWKGRQLQVSLSCCTELEPFWSSAEFPSLSQTRKHFRYFVLIHLWCLGFGTLVVYFGHEPRWKCAGKGGAPGRRGSGSPFLDCTTSTWPGPVLIQVISGLSILFLHTGMSEDAERSFLESTSTKYLEIHFQCLLARVDFFGYFLLFSRVLMTNPPSVGPSCWSFGGKTLWTLGFAVPLLKGLFRNAGRFEGPIPQCSCFFTHIPWEEQSTLGTEPLSCSDGSFLLAIHGPGGLFGLQRILLSANNCFDVFY